MTQYKGSRRGWPATVKAPDGRRIAVPTSYQPDHPSHSPGVLFSEPYDLGRSDLEALLEAQGWDVAISARSTYNPGACLLIELRPRGSK